jgi:predicted RNase H-like HicB family nuclease
MKKDLKFEIYHDGDFYCARCFDIDIFTQGETLDDLYKNIKEAVNLYFDESESKINKNEYNGIFAMMELAF